MTTHATPTMTAGQANARLDRVNGHLASLPPASEIPGHLAGLIVELEVQARRLLAERRYGCVIDEVKS